METLASGARSPEELLLDGEQADDHDAGAIEPVVNPLASRHRRIIPSNDPLSDPVYLAALLSACAHAPKLRRLASALEEYAMSVPRELRVSEERSRRVMTEIGLNPASRRDRGVYDQQMKHLRKKLPAQVRERARRHGNAATIQCTGDARRSIQPSSRSMVPRLIREKKSRP
jgi:hypothetical protein